MIKSLLIILVGLSVAFLCKMLAVHRRAVKWREKASCGDRCWVNVYNPYTKTVVEFKATIVARSQKNPFFFVAFDEPFPHILTESGKETGYGCLQQDVFPLDEH